MVLYSMFVIPYRKLPWTFARFTVQIPFSCSKLRTSRMGPISILNNVMHSSNISLYESGFFLLNLSLSSARCHFYHRFQFAKFWWSQNKIKLTSVQHVSATRTSSTLALSAQFASRVSSYMLLPTGSDTFPQYFVNLYLFAPLVGEY